MKFIDSSEDKKVTNPTKVESGRWVLDHKIKLVLFLFTGIITYMKFDVNGKYLFVCGDRVVRILHNVCGYYTTIASCQRLLGQKQTSATVERLKKNIQECKETLSTFGK